MKNKKVIFGSVLVLFFSITGIIYSINSNLPASGEIDKANWTNLTTLIPDVTETISHDLSVQKIVVVHVCGAVKIPGVFKLPLDSRVIDAVNSAGGFLEDAAEDSINQADVISDGMKIYIPTRQEVEELSIGDTDYAVSESSATDKVNINSAQIQVLMTLPGIGEAKAADIIKFREKNGKFKSIEEIMQVNGIKQAAFEKIKEKITVK